MTADRTGTSTASDGPTSTFADVDDELFDVGAVPVTTREARSVGEMLVDVDHQARQLLLDVDGDAAGPLVRGWPAMVAAAEELWVALPGRRLNETQDRPMERLAAHAGTIRTSLASGWPGPGPSDPRITHLAETLQSAADLVRRYGAEIPTHRPLVRDDLEAARTRTMHGLYVTAHAVNVALHAHGRDRYREARAAGTRVALSTVHSPYAIAPTGGWVSRFATAEATAGRYLTRGFADTVAGEARPPLTDPNRIPRALAGWDIQAHRTLATHPTAVNNVIIARTQALIAGAGLLLVDASGRQPRPRTEGGQDAQLAEASALARLNPVLEATGRAWSNLASRWDDLPARTDRPDPHLLRASAEVRAAYRELTHDATTTASPDLIATRPGLDRALTATLTAIEASPELADVLAEKVDNPRLVGRARALSIRANNDIEAGLATSDPTGDVVWVSPTDIHAKRMVPLPPPVAETLRAATDATIDATRSASTVATLHHHERTAAAPVVDPGLRGRHFPEDGQLPIATSSGPRR